MNRLRAGAIFALLTLAFNTLPVAAPAYNRRLPPAGFPVLMPSASSGQASSNGLPQVHGLHLSDGVDRPANAPAQVYNPGEPSAQFKLVRWEQNKMPLLIWISPGLKLPEVPFEQVPATRVDLVTQMLQYPDGLSSLPKCPGWTAETNNVVAAGFEEWREFEKEGLFKFGYVDDPRQAQILVFFVDSFKDAASPGGIMVGGNTCAQVYPLSLAHSMKIAQKPVIIELSTMVNHTDERMYGAAAHEFGHALGIKAHSDCRQDIMFRDRVVNHLSPSDKATIRWLYHHQPAYVM